MIGGGGAGLQKYAFTYRLRLVVGRLVVVRWRIDVAEYGLPELFDLRDRFLRLLLVRHFRDHFGRGPRYERKQQQKHVTD